MDPITIVITIVMIIMMYDTIGKTYATLNPTTSTWHHQR
jgi:hypothetical protein